MQIFKGLDNSYLNIQPTRRLRTSSKIIENSFFRRYYNSEPDTVIENGTEVITLNLFLISVFNNRKILLETLSRLSIYSTHTKFSESNTWTATKVKLLCFVYIEVYKYNQRSHYRLLTRICINFLAAISSFHIHIVTDSIKMDYLSKNGIFC